MGKNKKLKPEGVYVANVYRVTFLCQSCNVIHRFTVPEINDAVEQAEDAGWEILPGTGWVCGKCAADVQEASGGHEG